MERSRASIRDIDDVLLPMYLEEILSKKLKQTKDGHCAHLSTGDGHIDVRFVTSSKPLILAKTYMGLVVFTVLPPFLLPPRSTLEAHLLRKLCITTHLFRWIREKNTNLRDC